ncbi:hypothetical protein GC174_15650 [bacterium]|nr:hypothetical protein [bacterium]
MTDHKSLGIFLAATVWLCTALPARAQLSQEQLRESVIKARILPASTGLSLTLDRGNVLVEVRGYPSSKIQDKKIDAILITRRLVEADPANIKAVSTKYVEPSNPNAFTEIIVSNNEITGASAGAIDQGELLNGVIEVTIDSGDDTAHKIEKYVQAASRELDRNGLYEAEFYLNSAARLTPEAISYSSEYGSNLLRLAEAFRLRGDSAEQDKIYQSVSDSIGSAKGTPGALSTFRKLRDNYIVQKQFDKAVTLAAGVIKLQDNQGSVTADYQNDLLTLAICHRNLGDSKKAIAELEEILKHQESSAEKNASNKLMTTLYEELGDCYSLDNNAAKAQELYRKSKEFCDQAAVSRVESERISYDLYRFMVARLNAKINRTSSTP